MCQSLPSRPTFSNTTKYFDAFMVDSVTMFSSSAAKMSSVLRSLNVDLYSIMSRDSDDQVLLMDCVWREGAERGE